MMKKLLLLIMFCVMTTVTWAQYYKFTETAQGHLYTAKNDASVASTPKGGECKTSYYVKSDHALLEAPLPFTTTQSKSFKAKTYYVENAGNYTNAYELIFDAEGTTYYTASETLLNFSNDDTKAHYLESSEKTVFTNSSDVVNGYVYIKVGDDYVEQVKEGDIFDPTKTYALHNRPNQGDYTLTQTDLADWAAVYITTKDVYTFKNTILDAVYVNGNGIFTPITDNTYTEGKEYFTVTFNAIDDAVKADMASNPETYFEVKTTISDITVDYNVYTYNSLTGAYTKVNVGDTFLPGGEYYKDAEDFVLRTPAELLTLGYVYSVSGLVELVPDGTTLNIICSGDVCDPGDEFEGEGYKFVAKAVNAIYAGEIENSVKLDEFYNKNQEYYTREQKYVEVNNADVPTTTKYQLIQSAYVNNDGRYDFVNTGTDINDGAYYALENAGTAYTETVSTTDVFKFNDSANGWVYVKTDQYGNVAQINVKDELDPSKEYVIANTQYQPWNGNYTATTIDNLKSGTYVTPTSIVGADPVLYTMEGSSYIPAAGTVYDSDKTYYSGVSFTTIDNIKENTAYATPVTSVNPGATEYFVLNGETYTKVNAGETYDTGKTYYVKNGFDYTAIAEADLISGAYMTSATVANNYWEALANDINAAGYETVVFTTKEGDAEPATICNTVTRSMMLTTTVNALDYEKVQISSIESALLGGSAANPNGTFLYPSVQMKDKNTSISILLLPQIKDVEEIGGENHKHVPSYCCTQFPNLKLIVMPDNATCIEDNAFSTGSGGFSLETIVFNNTLERIESNAFNGNIKLTTLTFPATLKYIGQYAFNGGLNDIYFLGKDAPIVEKDAFGTEAYLNNNAIDDQTMEPDWYRITRDAYVSKNGYMAAMLHLPTGMSDAQRAAYTDPTRSYHVFEYLPYTIVRTTDKEGKTITTKEEALSAYPQATDATVGDDGITLYYGGIKSNNIDDEKEAMFGGALHKVYYCSGDASGADFTASWGNASASGVNAVMAGGRVWNSNLVVGKTFAFYPWGKGNFTAYTKGSDENYVEVEMNTEYNKEETYYICGTDETDIPAPNSYTVLTFDELKQKSIVLEVDVKGGWINDSNQNRWKNSGFYDLRLGMNYIWPSQTYMNRAFTAASNNRLWGGSMTIADGIAKSAAGATNTTVKFDSNCDGTEDKTYNDGEEYMGLHEFILVTFDVAPETNTQEWDFNTLGGKNWYTICVPVNMTAGEVRKAFGDNTQVCSFNNVQRRTDTDHVKIKFGFTEEHCYGHADNEIAIKANEAYMIRPGNYKDANHTFTLPQYTVADKVLPIPTTLTAVDGVNGNTYTYTFVGNYNTAANGDVLHMQKYTYFLGNAGNDVHKFFFQTGTTGNWKPYTCVILPSNGVADYIDFFGGAPSTSSAAKSANCAFGWDEYLDDEDAATVIEYEIVCGAENAKQETPIFNLNGQCVGNDVNTLPKGIYVKNGKKFIIK